MTVGFGRKSEKFVEKSQVSKSKMFLSSSNTGHSSSGSSSTSKPRADPKCQESEQWQSRVSFQPENGFSSESPVCRTMRTAVDGHHHNNIHQQQQQRYYQQQNNNNRLSSSISSSSSDKMLEKSIQKTIGILSRSKIARLFVKSSSSGSPRGGESCSHSSSHFYSKLSSPTKNSVPSSPTTTTSSTLYYNHQQQPHHLSTFPSSSASSYSRTSAAMSHHWASFGMILIAILMLSSFSTSSMMVMCVPLGGARDVEGGGESRGMERATNTEITAGGGVMGLSPSKIMQFTRKLQEQQQQQQQQQKLIEPVSIQTKEEIYLPSLLNGGGGGGTSAASQKQKEIIQSNYQLLKQQAASTAGEGAPIQKLQKYHPHKDMTRSIMMENPEIEVEDSDEMDNEVDGSGGRVGGAMMQVSSALGGGRGRPGNRDRDAKDDDDDESDDEPMVNLNGGAMGATDQSGLGQWETVLDPHLYVLTEWGNRNPYQKVQEQEEQGRDQYQISMFRQQRKRRNSGTGPSLSIVNPLDVLRQRLLLEIARRRMRQSHNQIIANEEILRKIGRR